MRRGVSVARALAIFVCESERGGDECERDAWHQNGKKEKIDKIAEKGIRIKNPKFEKNRKTENR